MGGTSLRDHSPIHAFMDFQELYQSNHGMARNCEAGGFVNSAIHKATSLMIASGSMTLLAIIVKTFVHNVQNFLVL